ncbi:hypothetical protein PR048_023333 [Dryococelus australis]|uniref:Uncharacterized protein n=1 Tax=Dryococelus australis TaxID=614101 RepID=A0ABQ9GTV1_9NEOP|nr:hypothetical protein PR048_023333 [Dryococelus australis]
MFSLMCDGSTDISARVCVKLVDNDLTLNETFLCLYLASSTTGEVIALHSVMSWSV